MNWFAWTGCALFLTSLFLAFFRHDGVGFIMAFAVAAIFYRLAFPELKAPPAMKSEGAEPQRISWGPLFLGVLSGAVGVYLWSGPQPRWIMGGVFQWVSMTSLLKAFPAWAPKPGTSPAAPIPAAPGSIPPVVVPPPSPAGPAVVPVAVVVLLLSAAVYYFTKNAFQSGLVYLAAGLLSSFVLALKYRDPETATTKDNTFFWIGVVLVIAAFMRLPFIGCDFTGLQIDEANHLWDGRNVLTGDLKTPFATGWWGNPSFVYFWYAFFFKLFGISVPVGRALSACLSIGALYLFYRVVRFYVAPLPSILATVMFMYSWYHMFYSLSPFTDIFTVFFELATFFFLERALREGKRSDYAWAGLWMAASVMSYISGRLVVGMVVISLGMRFLNHPKEFLKNHGRHVLLLFLAFLWLIGPFIVFVFHSPGDFMGRSQELSILNEVKRTGDYWFPARTYGFTLLSFFTNTNVDPRFGLNDVPVVDPLVAILLVVGLGLSFARIRSSFTWVVLPGFFVAVAANGFAIQGANAIHNYMNQQRFYLVLPFAFLLCARGLEWIFARFRGAAPMWRVLGALLLTASIAVAGGYNAWTYYHKLPHNPGTWDSLGFNHLQNVPIIKKYYPQRHIFVYWENYSMVQRFILQDKIPMFQFDDKLQLPILKKASKDVVIIFQPWRNQTLMAQARKIYPTAVWKDYLSPYGASGYVTAEISKAEFEKAQEGQTVTDPLP